MFEICWHGICCAVCPEIFQQDGGIGRMEISDSGEIQKFFAATMQFIAHQLPLSPILTFSDENIC